MSGPLSLFAPEADEELLAVVAEIKRLDPDGSRWAAVVRHTYDMIYNGAETGRFEWKDLGKTEKTHFGTLFEINAQREFGFADGSGDPDDPKHHGLDFNIAGYDVDAKWSQDDGKWMLPPEVFEKLALVATGSDPKSEFSLGVIRVRREFLTTNSKGNRDSKSWLSAIGREQVHWIWRHEPMPRNILLALSEAEIAHIKAPRRSGSERVARLFRATAGQLVHRTSVATIALQLDHQKRVRRNGGARDRVGPEGYLILSGVYHAAIAKDLGLPVPSSLEYIAARVVPADEGVGAFLEGRWWRVAKDDEPSPLPAPLLPNEEKRQKKKTQ